MISSLRKNNNPMKTWVGSILKFGSKYFPYPPGTLRFHWLVCQLSWFPSELSEILIKAIPWIRISFCKQNTCNDSPIQEVLWSFI